jgi:hypothetical protein
MDFKSGSGWSGAMALKFEDYDPITCENEQICAERYGDGTVSNKSTWPKVRRPNRFEFQNVLLTETPEEMHLVLDDVRPDLIQSVSVDFNFSHRFIWTRTGTNGHCALNYSGNWGQETLSDSTDCPADAWGNWILRPGELARMVDTSKRSWMLIRDGQNTVTFSVRNKIGLEHSQRVFFLKQAVPPRLDAMWPQQGLVLNNTKPVVSTLMSTVGYPGLEASQDAKWCVRRASNTTMGCSWESYNYLGKVKDLLDPDGKDSNYVFLDTALNASKELDDSTAWETVVQIGSVTEDGQNGKAFTLINTLKIDTTAPVLNLLATPERKTGWLNPSTDSVIGLLKWADQHRLRVMSARIYGPQGQLVQVLPLQSFVSQNENRIVWNGKSPLCGPALCPNGRYSLKILGTDEAVKDSLAYAQTQYVDTSIRFEVYQVNTDGTQLSIGSTTFNEWKNGQKIAFDPTYHVKAFYSDVGVDANDWIRSGYFEQIPQDDFARYLEDAYWNLLLANQSNKWNQANVDVAFNVRTTTPSLRIDSVLQIPLENHKGDTADQVLNRKELLALRLKVQDASLTNGDSATVMIEMGLSQNKNIGFKRFLNLTLRGPVLDTVVVLEDENSLLPSGQFKITGSWSDLANNTSSSDSLAGFKIDREAPYVRNVFASAPVFPILPKNPSLNFEVEGQASCRVKSTSPLGDTSIASQLTYNGLHALAKLDSVPMDADRVGQWLAQIDCLDSAGNESSTAAPYLVGVRPPVITSPMPLSELKHGVLAIKGMVYHPDPTRSHISGSVGFALEWKQEGESTWRKEGIRISDALRLSQDPNLNVGHRAVEAEQLLGTWDLSVLPPDAQVSTLQLRLRAYALDCEGADCKTASVTQSYIDGGITDVDSLKLMLVGLPQTVESGTGFDLRPLLTKSQSRAFAPGYDLNIHATDVSGQVLWSQNLQSPLTSLWGKPDTTQLKPGVSVWVDKLGLHVAHRRIADWSMPVKYLGNGAKDTLTELSDAVKVSRVTLSLGFDQKIKCPSVLPVGVSCQDTLVVGVNPKTMQAYTSSINVSFDAASDVDGLLLGQGAAEAISGNLMGLIQGDTAELNALKKTHQAMAIASGLLETQYIRLGQSQLRADSLGSFANVLLEHAKVLRWDGFAQSGDAYPVAGLAKLSLTVSEQGSNGIAQVLDTHFVITGATPTITGIQKAPEALYHSPAQDQVSMELGKIDFSFGLTGQNAQITAEILDAQGQVVRVLENAKDYRAVRAAESLPYRLSWNGSINGGDQNAAEGLYTLRLRALQNAQIVHEVKQNFEVKMSSWILAQTDASSGLNGNPLDLRFRESKTVDGQTFVQADGDYLISARAKASVHKPDTLDYRVKYEGNQDVYDMPAERFTVGIRRKRDRLTFDVITVVKARGWGKLSFDYGKCSWSDESGTTEYLAIKKTKMTFLKDQGPQEVSVSAANSQDYLVVDNKRNQIADGLSAAVLFMDPSKSAGTRIVQEIRSLNYNQDYKIDRDRAKEFYANLLNAGEVIQKIEFNSFSDHSDLTKVILSKDYNGLGKNGQTCNPNINDQEKTCKSESWDSNSDLIEVKIDVHPNSGSDGFAWGDADFSACGEHDHGDMNWGAKFAINIPKTYWDTDWGYNNMANSMMRFDPYSSDLKEWKVGERRLVTPLEPQRIDGDFGGRLEFEGVPKSSGTQESVAMRFYGDEQTDQKFQEASLYRKGVDTPTLRINNKDMNQTSIDLGSEDLTATFDLEVKLKVKKDELLGKYASSITYPASEANWLLNPKNPLCTDAELSATSPTQKLCSVRYPLASGIKYFAERQNKNLPSWMHIQTDVDGYVIPNGYQDKITWEQAQPVLGSYPAKIGLVEDTTSVILTRYNRDEALGIDSLNTILQSGKNGRFNFGVGVNIVRRVVEFDKKSEDWDKISVNNQGLRNYIADVDISMNRLAIARKNSSADLTDWNSALDTSLGFNRLGKEYPISIAGGKDNPIPNNIFLRATNLWGDSTTSVRKWIPLGTASVDSLWSKAYLKGMQNAWAPAHTSATPNSLLMFAAGLHGGGTYYPNHKLIDLKLYDLELMATNGRKHALFKANWQAPTEQLSTNHDTLFVNSNSSNDGLGSIAVSRQVLGSQVRFDEWVTVLADKVWDSSQVYYSNRGKVVPVFSSNGTMDTLLWKSADQPGVSSIDHLGKTMKVLGYLNLSRLNGSTSFYLVKHGIGKSYYQKFDLMVGERVKSNLANISSIYGDAVVNLPAQSYGNSTVALTVRTVSPKENQVVNKTGLPVVGPVVEVLPSYDFCAGKDPCVEKPQVRIRVLKQDLKDPISNLEKNPMSLSLYKLKDNEVVPLENVTWLFWKGSLVCGDTIKTSNGTAPCVDWDAVDLTGSTSSFSDFALLDTGLAPRKNYSLMVTPLVSAALLRQVKFSGTDKVDFYLDDDALLVDTTDATAAQKVVLANVLSDAQGISGEFTLPQRSVSYLHAVPVGSKGEILPHYPMAVRLEYSPELQFAYTGSDTIWLGNFNGQLQIPYTSNANGVLRTLLRSKEGKDLYSLDQDLEQGSILKINAPLPLQGRDTLRVLLGATSLTGDGLQILGPVVRVDSYPPRLDLQASLKTDGFGGKLRVQLQSTDSGSGLSYHTLRMRLGNQSLFEGQLRIPNVDTTFVISRTVLEKCLGCALTVEAKAFDFGFNADSAIWSDTAVYPLPKGLWAWYPMGEGFGDLALDLGPSMQHLKVTSITPWFEKEALRMGFASDSAKSPVWPQNGPYGSLDTSWTVEGWFKGMGTQSPTRDLWTWQTEQGDGWRIYREGSDLIYAQGAIHQRFAQAFEADGLWSHFALTYHQNQLSLWRNAKRLGQLTVNLEDLPAGGRLRLAGGQGAFAFFKDWRFYQKSLDSSEITSLFHYRDDHSATWTIAQAENGQLSTGLIKDVSCALKSRQFVRAKSPNKLSFWVNVAKAGVYGLAAQIQGTGSASVSVNGTPMGSLEFASTWQRQWLKSSAMPSQLTLSAGAHRVEIQLSAGQMVDWIALSTRSDMALTEIPENVVSIATATVEPSMNEVASGSQYANVRLQFKNIGSSVIQGYKLRYYFKESAPLKEALIWDTDKPASATFNKDDLGNEYVEVAVPTENVVPGAQNVPSRGLSLALRPMLYNGDWSSKWVLTDDPSWVSGANQVFVRNPGIQVLSMANEPLSGLFCPESASPIQAPPSVQVIAMEGQPNELRASNPQFTIENTGRVALDKPILRYYFTVSEQSTVNVSQWNQISGVAWNKQSLGNGNWILEVKYPNMLLPNTKTNPYSLGSYQLSVDWPNAYNKVDDWSNFGLTTTSKVSDQITVHDITGKLLWGKIPTWAQTTNTSTDASVSLDGSDLVLDLKKSGTVRVRLVSVSGVDAGTLYTGELQVGVHRWSLNSTQLSQINQLKVVVELNGRVVVNQGI